LDDLDIVVDWALRKRVNLIGFEQIMATGGVFRLNKKKRVKNDNIEDI
jgi:hypothetical protein